ncbi:MAG: glycosyltransferase [Acidobacteria bacterium]|nr:glycosyltransferase [Acidobacteriota bacterium]
MKGPVVLLTTNLARGGAETQVAQLALALRRSGWDVHVVSLVRPSAFVSELAPYSLGMRPGVPDPLGVARLVWFLRRVRPRILHSHMFHANLLARLVRLVCPVPVVISTLHSMAESSRASADVRWRDWLYRVTDRLSDATVAVSEAVAERHASAGAVPRAKLRVVLSGVDTAHFRPDPERRVRMRAALGLGEEFAWLAVGRLMWKKDYPAMLRALARQRAGTLFIAGAGPQEAELRALARELGVDARFLGPREDIAELMNGCDGLLLSSRVEGLPVVLLEAAASGLPCVATGVGGVREAVEDGRTGYVVAPEEFAAAMTRLASLSAGQRRQMSQAARALALSRFDLTHLLANSVTGYSIPNCVPVSALDSTSTKDPPAAGADSKGDLIGERIACHRIDVTGRFGLEFAGRWRGGRILDYGCGAGWVVAAGRAAGIDITGVDVYYGGSRTREEAESAGLLGSAVHEMPGGRIPFPDAWFDLVVNNQVLEHVADLDAVLTEIHRVLKPGGAVLSIFPARDVFREGHIGIPFAHWFPKDSRLRFYYTWALRRLGLGTWKQEAPTCRQWAIDKLRWIDIYTHYRSRREIFRAFDRYFESELHESEYIRLRLLDRPGRRLLADLAKLPLVRRLARAVFRKLAFLVIVSRKGAP